MPGSFLVFNSKTVVIIFIVPF